MAFNSQRSSPCSIALLFAGAVLSAHAQGRVGNIEFFGYKDLDVQSVRKALPVREGDEYGKRIKNAIREAVVRATGKEPTDVAGVCCDENGNLLIFIGLRGASYKEFDYNPEPKGADRLPSDIVSLYRRLDKAMEAAVRKGGTAAEEDDTNGYALIREPVARGIQLEVHRWAVGHEDELLRVLASSASVEDRRVASDALGYGQQTPRQIPALVHAARDPDNDVRNNVTRALGVLVRSNVQLGQQIQPGTFIVMLRSGVWTDHNKAAALLDAMTTSRDADLLARIREGALDSLIEMASWRGASHAYTARMVLGRLAGIPEQRLNQVAWSGPVQEILDAARGLR